MSAIWSRRGRISLFIATSLWAGAGALAQTTSSQASPDEGDAQQAQVYLRDATRLLSEHQTEAAVNKLRHAVELDAHNSELWVAYGDAMNLLVARDSSYLWKARDAWMKAAAVDSTSKTPLTRLLKMYSDLVDIFGAAGPFDHLHKVAEDLLRIDPGNVEAEVAAESSIIRPSIYGKQVDEKAIDEALGRLTALMEKAPDNSDAPAWIAQTKLRQAQILLKNASGGINAALADRLTAEATQVVEDAVKRQPNNAAMYFAASQIMGAEQGVAEGEKDSPQQAALAQAYLKRKAELLEKARQLAQVDDPLYVFIHLNAAQAAAQRQDRAGAEQILRALLAKKPDDQQVRLALANHIAFSGKRDEAIEILERPIASPGVIGPRALLAAETEVQTLTLATNLRLDVLAGAAPEQQAQMLPIIEQGIASVAAKDRQRIRPLLLRGKLLRIRGKVIEAIQTLEQARELVDKDPASSDHRMARWEIYDLLARCYIDSHQDGSAQKLLESLVAELPNYGPARILLTQILIHGRDLDAARKNLDVLEKSKPNDPAVLKLRLQVLDPATQRAQIAEVYGRLPEREKAEAMDKVNSAMAVGEKEDAIRLVERLRREYPHDLAVTVLAVKVYHSQHEPYRARELAQEGLADHPGNLQLKVELEALDREAGR